VWWVGGKFGIDHGGGGWVVWERCLVWGRRIGSACGRWVRSVCGWIVCGRWAGTGTWSGRVSGIGRLSGTAIGVSVGSLIEFDTTKDIDIGIGIHPRDPRIPLIRKAGL